MKIEKIEKVSKEIKEFLNNIDAIGIYYNCVKKNKPLEIQLSFEKFFKIFQNNIKKAYINITFENSIGEELEHNEPVKKFINSHNYYYGSNERYDCLIYYKIGNIKYFALINNTNELKKIRMLL